MTLALVLLVTLTGWNVMAFSGRNPAAVASRWVDTLADNSPTRPASTAIQK